MGARRAVLAVLICCSVSTSATETTLPPPTLTTIAAQPVIDRQKEYHCSDKPSSVCGPRVLLCQLVKDCSCAMTPADLETRACSCCEACIACLGPYLTECCACVGLCELSPPSDSQDGEWSHAEEEEEEDNEVEQLDTLRPETMLFEAHFAPLEESKQYDRKWQMYNYSVAEEPGPLGMRLEKSVALSLPPPAHNCTVVYFEECMSRQACEKNCKTLTASSFRWFVTGCCECAGTHCRAGGSGTARCNQCRHEDFPQIEEDEEEELMMRIAPTELKEL